METQMTIREAVLDALADDEESIVQIENYLRCFKSDIEREEVKHILIELLQNEWIHIVHPPKKRPTDFENSYDDAIESYWFEQTAKGHEEWTRIENLNHFRHFKEIGRPRIDSTYESNQSGRRLPII